MMQIAEYGLPVTTTLAKGLAACLRFRFLLLERESRFDPASLDLVTEPIKRKEAGLLLSQEMTLVDRMWREAGLADPEKLLDVMGHERKDMAKEMGCRWDKCRGRLRLATAAVLAAATTDLDAPWSELLDAIGSFRREISKYNRDLLLMMLERLKDEVSKAASDDDDHPTAQPSVSTPGD